MQVNFAKPLVSAQTPNPTAPPSDINPPSLPYQDLAPLQLQQQLAEGMLQQGANSSPMRGGLLEGLGRLINAGAGGYFLNKSNSGIASAKASNRNSLKNDLQSGDWSSLLTSGDPIGEKLGSAILEQQLSHQPGTYRTLENGTVVWQGNMGGPPTIISRPTTGLPRGYMWNENGDQVFIPGGPADPSVIARNAAGRRAPAAPDQTGVAPWLRKW